MDSNTIKLKLDELQQRRGRQKQLAKQLSDSKYKLRVIGRDIRLREQAQIIIQNVAKLTQKEIEFKIGETVSLALASVFPDPYKLEVDFVVRHNKTEADLWFVRRGERVHPYDASGGGAVDVASFALRVALWSLQRPRNRNVLILDEPFPHLSSDMQAKAHEVLFRLSKDIGLQIIMVSHVQEAVDEADRIFIFNQRNGVTNIKEGR